jgi:hypothetical protein
MPKAVCLFRGKSLLNDNAPELSVVRDNRRPRPDGLATCRSTLKRIETILEPIINVVNLRRLLIGEIEPEREFQPVIWRVSDWRRPLAFRHSPVHGFPPRIPRPLVLRNPDRHFEWTLRHQVSVLVRSRFGYQPAGVIFTFQYDLKSDMCSLTSSTDAEPAKPRRSVRRSAVPSTIYSGFEMLITVLSNVSSSALCAMSVSHLKHSRHVFPNRTKPKPSR